MIPPLENNGKIVQGEGYIPDDKITWDVEVLADGWFDVEIHYTCPPEDIGSTFELSFGTSSVRGKITEGHDPPLRGMENDKIERQESYVKDFKPLHIGRIFLYRDYDILMS